jgi:hypothetical protein
MRAAPERDLALDEPLATGACVGVESSSASIFTISAAACDAAVAR